MDVSKLNSKQQIFPKKVSVLGKEYVWWSNDHASENREYVRNLSVGFIKFKLEAFANHKNEQEKSMRSVALSQLYVETMETLLASIIAYQESCDSFLIWMNKYKNIGLENKILALKNSKSKGGDSGNTNYEIIRISDSIFYSLGDGIYNDRNRFLRDSSTVCTILHHVINEYTGRKLKLEYNSIKHGHRAIAGGSTVYFQQDFGEGSFGELTPLISIDEGVSFVEIETIRAENKIPHLASVNNSSSLSDERIHRRIESMEKIYQLLIYSLNARVGNRVNILKVEFGKIFDEIECWMPDKDSGAFHFDYVYTFSDHENGARELSLNLSVTRRISANYALSAFSTDYTDVMFQYCLAKTFYPCKTSTFDENND